MTEKIDQVIIKVNELAKMSNIPVLKVCCNSADRVLIVFYYKHLQYIEYSAANYLDCRMKIKRLREKKYKAKERIDDMTPGSYCSVQL